MDDQFFEISIKFCIKYYKKFSYVEYHCDGSTFIELFVKIDF